MNSGDTILMVCPKCEDLTELIYKKDEFEIIDECSCLKSNGLKEWATMITLLFDDMEIMKIPDSEKMDKLIEEMRCKI